MTVSNVLKKYLYKTFHKLNITAEKEMILMRNSQWLLPEQIKEIQQRRLKRLVTYSYKHVPYYRKLFSQVRLINNGRLHMQNFKKLPILEKSTIRDNYKMLISDIAVRLKSYENKTGGSTGEPLIFLQDRKGARISGSAVLSLFYGWHDISAGDREVKLWGSEADIFYPKKLRLKSFRKWLSNVITLNAFRMTKNDMFKYIKTINEYKPKLLRGYSSNLFELAQFAEENNLIVRPPNVVISSAGTLYPFMREKIEAVYGCPVYNHYGSREMHNMAMECPHRSLHMSAFTHLIEILDDKNQPCMPGVEGNLVVTSFVNHAMPFIRYSIGDRAAISNDACSCGRGLPTLEKLSGRVVNAFRTNSDRIVPGEYFIHLLGVHLKNNPIKKFQVVQKNYNKVIYKIIMLKNEILPKPVQQEIKYKTLLAMGDKCKIEFDFVKEIPPSSNGKYFYTVSEI